MNALPTLIGKFGIAKSPLHASGLIEIDGQLFEAQSRLEPIARGDPVVVIDVYMNILVVKKHIHKKAA